MYNAGYDNGMYTQYTNTVKSLELLAKCEEEASRANKSDKALWMPPLGSYVLFVYSSAGTSKGNVSIIKDNNYLMIKAPNDIPVKLSITGDVVFWTWYTKYNDEKYIGHICNGKMFGTAYVIGTDIIYKWVLMPIK